MAKRTDFERSVSRPEAGPISQKSLLLPNPTAALIAKPTIAHPQLRHLVSCPIRRGIVYSVSGTQILEFDLLNPQNEPRCMIILDFNGEGPASFSATSVPSLPNTVLFAAGGLKSQVHLSLHSLSSPDPSTPSKPLWRQETRLTGGVGDIVNAVIFIPTSLTDISRTEHPRAEFRLITCINDHHVNIYDIYVGRDVKLADRLKLCGRIPSGTNVNHATLSPDGSALLLVGDTPNVYLYTLHPGHTLTFTEIITYTLPSPPITFFLRNPSIPSFFSSRACFASSWSSCGLKFAVGSQEGQLCVWDVRSATPIFEYWADMRLMPKSRSGRNSQGDMWLWMGGGGDGNGPASGIREVKFSAGSDGQRELLLWTEHTLNLHVIDARTFDMTTHMVIPFPSRAVSPQSEVPENTIVSLSEISGAEVGMERTPSPSRSPDWSMHDEGITSNLSRRRGSSPSPMRVDNDNTSSFIFDAQSRTQAQSQPAPIPGHEASGGEIVAEFTPPSPPPFAPPSFPLSLRVSLPQSGLSRSPQTHPEPSTSTSIVTHSPLSQLSRLNTPQNRIIARLRVPGPPGRERWQASLTDFSLSAVNESGARVSSGAENDEMSRAEGSGGEWVPIAGRTITLPLSALAPLRGDNWGAGDGSESSGSINADETTEDRFRRIEALIERALAAEATLSPPSETGGEPSSNETQRRSSVGEVRLRLNMAARLAGLNADLDRERIAVANRIRPGDASVASPHSNNTAASGEEREEAVPEIAGMCLDPTGGWVYVASSVGIVEWRVREREEGRGGAIGGWR